MLLDAGCDVGVKNFWGSTPLHSATKSDNPEVVRMLLHAGCDVEEKDRMGSTPLHSATETGSRELVRMLLYTGCDVEIKDERDHLDGSMLKDLSESIGMKNFEGWSGLHFASLRGWTIGLERLLQDAADPNETNYHGWSPLAIASALGNPNIVKILLSDCRTDPSLANDNGYMPLDYASYYNHSEVLKLLEAAKAKLNFVMGPGQSGSRVYINTETVDGISAMLESMKEATKLEKREEDLCFPSTLTGNPIHETTSANAKDRKGITLLHYAALGGHDSLIKSLISAGGNMEPLTRDGASVLHFASLSGRLSTVKIVAEKVDRGLVDHQGFTPEQYAQACGHLHISSWLSKGYNKPDHSSTLSLKALKNLLGENLRKVCYSHINIEAAETLLNCGIWDLHYQDKRGLTSLHMAALNNRIEEVEFLLEHGALPSARTHDLKTPGDLASILGHHEIASLLSRSQLRTKVDKCRLHEQLLTLIRETSQEAFKDHPRRCLEAVKKCTSLLESGAPVEPFCCHDNHALHFAITWNCIPLLPLLLCTGVPLTSSADSLGLVELAWRSENVTPWARVLVTRAVEDKLTMEMEFRAETPFDKIMKRMMDELIVALRGDQPWRAECPSFPIPETNVLDCLLYTACARGATTAAWWIWKKGGHSNFSTNQGSTPLHAAIKAGNMETASALINNMKGNPFLKNKENRTAWELFPEGERKKHLENFVRREFCKLTKVLLKAKDNCDKRDLMQQILFHLVLTHQFTYKPVSEHLWKSVLRSLIEALPEQVSPHTWIPDLVTLLTHKHQNSKIALHFTYSEDMCEYSVLTEMTKKLFDFTDPKVGMQNADHRFYQDHRGLRMTGMRLCCEENLPLFLNLLVTIAGVSVEEVIDTDYNVTALHHAAGCNNLSTIKYLVNHRAKRTPRDKFGNIPSHYAFVNGFGDIFQELNCPFVNSLGISPCETKTYFTHYMEYYQVSTVEDGLSLQERTNVMQVTNMILKPLVEEWEERGIECFVHKVHVDFTEGEPGKIMAVINELINSLMTEVKLSEPLLEGKHKVLGSSADKVRLYCPDEYDCNVELAKISGYEGVQVSITSETVDNEGRTAFIKLSSDKEEIQHLLQGSNLLDKFYEVIKECFPNCPIADKRLTVRPPGVRRTQVGVELSFLWHGSEFKMLNVGVDLVPTIKAPWPDQLPRPMLTPKDLRSVYINSTGEGKWRFSFAHAENMIMINLTDEQRTVYLVCKIILSRLKPEAWLPRLIKDRYKYFNEKFFNIPVPKGFCLKNSFFRELEEVSNASGLWTQEHRFERIVSVFKRMCIVGNTLDFGKIKAYFGGDFEGVCVGFGAPNIVRILECLENKDFWHKEN